MSTTLANALIALSKDLGDYWASAATSTGTATTIIDTALQAKADDWISDAPQEMYARITSGTYSGEERKIISLDSTSGTLTTLAFTGAIASGVTYEVHRMFSASDKRIALIRAAKNGFPYIYKKIRDHSKTVGNWLLNGDVEIWTVSTYPDNWAVSALTAAANTTAPYCFRGTTSAKLTGAAGYMYQSNTQLPRFIEMAGESVTFTAEVLSNVASDTRLSIYDGTTTTYSDYHDGDSKQALLSVTATIADSPSEIRFAIHRGATSTVYADDFRVYGPTMDRLYIGDLGLARNYPHSVWQQGDDYIYDEPWESIRHFEIGSDGYLYLGEGEENYQLRIIGIGYLDFLVSGVSSTAWTATIDLDEPELSILVAEAIMYLYSILISPNYTSGDRERVAPFLEAWGRELGNRRIKFGMRMPNIPIDWGIKRR